MERPKQLVLIRHAESARNLAKKGAAYFADEEARKTIRGIPDQKIELTEEGWQQARETGIYLRRNFALPNYIYHSGFTRTIQTMDGILEAYTAEEKAGMQIRMSAAVRERHPGYAYDMTQEEAERYFPYLHEYWQTFGGFLAEPPGGESLANVSERVYRFLSMIFRERKGETVFVVTHGGTLRCFRFLLDHWTYDQALQWPDGQAPHNCGITVYNYDPGRKNLVRGDTNIKCY